MILVIGGYFLWIKAFDKKEDMTVGEVESRVNLKERIFFIVQTYHQNPVKNINFEELKNVSVVSNDTDIEQIGHIFNTEIKLIEGDLYSWVKNNNYKGYVVTSLDNADFKLKTVRIDDILIWDDEASSYPLFYEKEYNLNDQNKKEEYSSDEVITYVAGGEVIPARAVARKYRRTGDYKFPFYDVKELFVNSDISSILLENAINGYPDPCHGCMWFVGDEKAVEGLEFIDVDVVSMAGNHMGDGQRIGIKRTIEVLEEAKIKHTGASDINLKDASKAAVVEEKGISFAFLGYDDVAHYHWASEDRWGVASLSTRIDNGLKILNTEKIRNDVERAKAQGDYVIVLMSWGGREYVNWALDYQKEIGHALIDAGVDMIVGSHQHWVNEIEFYKGKPIFYGLGNFVFDQTHTDPTRQGIFIKTYFYEGCLVHFEIIPHETCGPNQKMVDNESCIHFQPQLLSEEDPVYEEIFYRLWEFSDI